MNRRSLLIGGVIALVAPLLPGWAQARLFAKPVPRLERAGLAPRHAGINAPWADDCLRWRGRVLTGERAHWCWDWHGLPVDETTPEHDSCTCVWTQADLDAPVFKTRHIDHKYGESYGAQDKIES